MLEIDFLPIDYRQRHAKKRIHTWRLAVVGGAAALIAITAVGHRLQVHAMKQALGAIETQYQEAVADQGELADIEAQLKRLRSEADLFAYLAHPWPKTQLLSAVLEPLPGALRLEQLNASRETVAATQFALAPSSRSPAKSAEEVAKLAPVERDLGRLREEYDKRPVVVRLSGWTTDNAALHAYLAEVGRNPLVARAELESLEADDVDGASTTRFRAIVVIRPAHGQPGEQAPSKSAGKSPDLAQAHQDGM